MAFSPKDRFAGALDRLRIALGGEAGEGDILARSQDRIMQARDAFARTPRPAPRNHADIQFGSAVFPVGPEARRAGRAASLPRGMDTVLAGHLLRYAETHFERGDRMSGQFALKEAQRCEADALHDGGPGRIARHSS